MTAQLIDFDKTNSFSKLFLDYIHEKSELSSYYSHFPSIENFKKAIDQKQFSEEKRVVLSNTLLKQYEHLSPSEKVLDNIQKFKKPNTFCITTGHQLNIFTGPLYFIYKIVSVINICKKLKENYLTYDFVPVYWMASEDHDFEEINHFYKDGKKYEWKTNQTGAVGHFDPSGLLEICKQLPKSGDFFNEAYSEETLAKAARNYVNYLFGEEGLVVIDADNRDLKRLFTGVIKEDIFGEKIQKSVEENTKALQKLGYKTQVNARGINFFYLDKNIRERIEKTEDVFQVVNTDIRFSESEIQKMIEESPEKFSPNVVLRPLYQETILPNLAYIGGPSEVAYWLQLKGVFDYFDEEFPVLMPRNFATIVPNHTARKWKKIQLEWEDIFLSEHQIQEKWVRKNTNKSLSLDEEFTDLQQIFSNISDKTKAVDVTLAPHILAIQKLVENKITRAEKKLIRAEKRNHSDKLTQIWDVKNALFPLGSLQERKINFLTFYETNSEFVHQLLQIFDGFEFKHYLLFEEN